MMNLINAEALDAVQKERDLAVKQRDNAHAMSERRLGLLNEIADALGVTRCSFDGEPPMADHDRVLAAIAQQKAVIESLHEATRNYDRALNNAHKQRDAAEADAAARLLNLDAALLELQTIKTAQAEAKKPREVHLPDWFEPALLDARVQDAHATVLKRTPVDIDEARKMLDEAAEGTWTAVRRAGREALDELELFREWCKRLVAWRDYHERQKKGATP